jgi:manganese/zinc/iron transport system substrate-binding protein
MKRNLFMILAGWLLLVVAGCQSGKIVDDGKLKVVATTGMIGDAVINIAGDNVKLSTLMGPGVDPHLYKATKGDIDNLNAADIIIYNGLYLEAKMAEIFSRMGQSRTTLAVGAVIPDSLLRFPTEFKGHPDPHIWFDLSLWERAVEEVMTSLATLDSVNANQYRSNGAAYLDSVRNLHGWVIEQIALIPEDQRILVTAHDAFGYFGRAYNMEVKGLQGISTVSEAGLYDVTRMVDMLVAREIRAVFVESSVPRKAIEAVVNGCRERSHEITIGGELFSDAMGEEGTPDGTYLGMVRHNVNTIVNALR